MLIEFANSSDAQALIDNFHNGAVHPNQTNLENLKLAANGNVKTPPMEGVYQVEGHTLTTTNQST